MIPEAICPDPDELVNVLPMLDGDIEMSVPVGSKTSEENV